MMGNKKLIQAGLFLLLGVLLVSSISIVSAKHAPWHFWGKEEPELAPFDATVSLTNAAPTIVAFRATLDDVPTGLGRVTPITGTTVTAHVTFIVEDPNYDNAGNPDELPGINPANVISVGPVAGAGNVYVTLTSPTNAPVGSGRTATATSCVASSCHTGADPACNSITVGQGDGSNPVRQVKYTCDVPMQYYFAPGPGAFPAATPPSGQQFWHITAEIEDVAVTIDSVGSGTVNHKGVATYDFDDATCTGATEVGDCDYIDYFTVSEIEIAPGDVGIEDVVWSGVSTSLTDTPAGDGSTGGDTGLTLRNIGNTVVNTIDLFPNDLTGVNDINAILQAESMSIGIAAGVQSTNVGACDVPGGGGAGTGGIILNPETDIINLGTAGLFPTWDVPYTASGNTIDNEELYFCIWSNLASATNCEGAPCLVGSDSGFNADNVCVGGFPPSNCDTVGEQWEVRFKS